MSDFEVYFDDSGTHSESDIAIGSCFVAPKEQWDWFVKNLDEAREREGFDCFHMADCMAGRKEFAGWNDVKRERVLRWLTEIIRTRATIGFSCGVPRKAWDEYTPERYVAIVGKRQYTFAVRSVMGIIEQWRTKFGYTQPMRYVFDRMSQGKGEIMAIMDTAMEFPSDCLKKYGVVKGGYSFEDKRAFKPLQAADMLAWETYNYMRTVVIPNRPSDPGTRNFQQLRKRPFPLTIAWQTDAQVKKMIDQMTEYESQTGKLPFWNESGVPPTFPEGFKSML